MSEMCSSLDSLVLASLPTPGLTIVVKAIPKIETNVENIVIRMNVRAISFVFSPLLVAVMPENNDKVILVDLLGNHTCGK